MELATDNYRVAYDETSNTLLFSGRLRSADAEMFKRMDELLDKAGRLNKLSMVWDLRRLDDLNSAGLGVLYRFVAKQRDNPDYVLKVKANNNVCWQGKSLPNLKKLMPKVQLEFHQI